MGYNNKKEKITANTILCYAGWKEVPSEENTFRSCDDKEISLSARYMDEKEEMKPYFEMCIRTGKGQRKYFDLTPETVFAMCKKFKEMGFKTPSWF